MFCTVMRGDSDETGSWNTIWILVRSVFSSSPLAPSTSIGPWPLLKATLPLSGVTARINDLADGGLAAAAFADQAEAFAAPDVEADAVDGAHRRVGVLAEPARFRGS